MIGRKQRAVSLLFPTRIMNMGLNKFIHCFFFFNYLAKTYLVPTMCKTILGYARWKEEWLYGPEVYGGTTFNPLHQNNRCNHQKLCNSNASLPLLSSEYKLSQRGDVQLPTLYMLNPLTRLVIWRFTIRTFESDNPASNPSSNTF